MKKIGMLFGLFCNIIFSQEAKTIKIFDEVLINFSEKSILQDDAIIRLQSGRLLVKKITIPEYKKGTDVFIEVTLRSNGDPWDKSGSCFVFKEENAINVINVAQFNEKFPLQSGYDNDYLGIKSVSSYDLPIELLRFMTPFGVGYFSNEKKYSDIRYYRPVSVPTWENQITWKQDISQLESLVTGTFYIGIWIDTWTEKGYLADVTLSYSGRPRPKQRVIPLINTIYYVDGQKIPDLFAKTSLKHSFDLPKDAKNTTLYYITTGHGGHSEGDEFEKINNSVWFDTKKVIDFIPWRDDCAAFRRYNPSSGVWLRQDTAFAYNENNERIRQVIQERLASSDISRSNWCPGSDVVPQSVKLGTLKKGKHTIEIKIPATFNIENQQNHWLVSSYLVFDR